MYNEIKCLCAEKSWRKAVEFALCLKPEARPGRIESLVFIGKAILTVEPESDERDGNLALVINALLGAHHIESLQVFLLALHSEELRSRYALSMGELISRRRAETELTDNNT